MRSMPETTITTVRADELDREPFDSLRGDARREGCIARGMMRNGSLIAVAVIDPDGRATMPGHPTMRLAASSQRGPDDHEMAALLRDLIEKAISLGAKRLSVGWDPMDFSGLKRLEAAGFRSAGSLPYFEMGGGHVEYVTGYQDATGSTMDMVIELSR